MKSPFKAGFTIVEIMLFLAVSGALIMGVLIGTGNAINMQRYRDSVMSLQSNLQQQYSNVANVNNDRDSSWSCDSRGLSQGVLGSGPSVGQSDCVLLGKYITNDDNKLIIKNVVGFIPDDVSFVSNDIDILNELDLHISQIAAEEYDAEWGSKLLDEDDGRTLNFSVLILRSPASGIIRTFINSDVSISENRVKELINRTALSESLKICVDSEGVLGGTNMAVTIKENASSPSSVEVLGDDSGC